MVLLPLQKQERKQTINNIKLTFLMSPVRNNNSNLSPERNKFLPLTAWDTNAGPLYL